MKLIFGILNFKILCLLKLGPIFHEVAKLGKATWDAYNWIGLLILYALLKNWVAEDRVMMAYVW